MRVVDGFHRAARGIRLIVMRLTPGGAGWWGPPGPGLPWCAAKGLPHGGKQRHAADFTPRRKDRVRRRRVARRRRR